MTADPDAVRAARMDAQLLGRGERGADVVATVRHMVGIQAQEPRAATLSIRARSDGLTAADVEREIAGASGVVRMWAMRGTLHLVAREDAGWLHELYAPMLLPAEHRSLDKLGVPDEDRDRAVEVIREALADGPLTRTALCERLDAAGIDTAGQRAAHLPRLAALHGHVCFGPRQGSKDTYALAGDWIGDGPPRGREDALAELARRYVAAYAPAEPEDFAAWAGLPLGDARAAWPEPGAAVPDRAVPDPPVVRLIPAFDTYLLGYRNRDLAVPAAHARKVFPGGGILLPTVLRNGLAVGTWRLVRANVEVQLWDAAGTDAETADIARFLDGA